MNKIKSIVLSLVTISVFGIGFSGCAKYDVVLSEKSHSTIDIKKGTTYVKSAKCNYNNLYNNLVTNFSHFFIFNFYGSVKRCSFYESDEGLFYVETWIENSVDFSSNNWDRNIYNVIKDDYRQVKMQKENRNTRNRYRLLKVSDGLDYLSEVPNKNYKCNNSKCNLIAEQASLIVKIKNDANNDLILEWNDYSKIKNNYYNAIKNYDYSLVSKYSNSGVKPLLNQDIFDKAIKEADTLKKVNTIIKIANNESIYLDDNIIISKKNQINYENKFANLDILHNPIEIKDYLNNSDNLIGIEKSKIDELTMVCISLFRKKNNFDGYKGAYELSNNIQDLDNMSKSAKTKTNKLFVDKTLEYLAINKNNESREKYFSFSKPKKNLQGSDKMDNTYLGNAILADFYEMGQGKVVGQFGENIMKALAPSSSSSAIVKFDTTMYSKAKYGTYKVKVKFTLKYKTKTHAQVLGIHNNTTSYQEYHDTVDYIISPNSKNKQTLNFGKIQLSFAGSSIGAFASADSISKVEDFKYEIINIKPIN